MYGDGRDQLTAATDQLLDADKKIQEEEADGGTYIYGPIRMALDHIKEQGIDLKNYTPAIILMTDGQSIEDDSFAETYKSCNMNIPIFSIMFGDADPAQLNALAELTNARGYIEQIRRLGENAGIPSITEGARALVRTGRDIMTYLSENVDRIPQARRFLNYYLDTAVQILKKYTSLKKNHAPQPQMQKVTQETVQAVETLKQAFEDQYQKLLSGDVMDIETDIEVLRNASKMDGVNDEI